MATHLQVFPHNEGFHRAHLQALQCVGHPKNVLASVLADLVKKPAVKIRTDTSAHISSTIAGLATAKEHISLSAFIDEF